MDRTRRKVESICRLCLGEDEKHLIRASELMTDSLSVQDFERFTGIQIQQDEWICGGCGDKVSNSIAFRTLCMHNDGLFKQLFAMHVESTSSKEGPVFVKISSNEEAEHAYATEEHCMALSSANFQTDINIEILDTIGPGDNSIPRVQYVFQERALNPDAAPGEEYEHASKSSLDQGDKNYNSNLDGHLSNDELDEPGENLEKDELEKDLHEANTNQLYCRKTQRNYRRCNTCGIIVTDLKSHMVTHTRGRNFHRGNRFSYHRASQHGNQEYGTECNICSKKFANLTSYRIHYGRYHAAGVEKNRPKTRKKQLCGECGIMVTQLSTHSLTHSQEKHLACPHCPIKMADKGNLSRHIQAVHLKKVVRSCETCGKEFLHVNLYKYHMLAQHGIGKTFDCDVCSKKFKTLGGLKIHKVSVHSNEKRYECGTCGMMFKVKHTLRTHEKRVHSAEKPFACSLCPKRFKSPYGKKSHELTHSGIVFACTLCEKSYRYKSLLQTHVKKQHSSLEEISMEH